MAGFPRIGWFVALAVGCAGSSPPRPPQRSVARSAPPRASPSTASALTLEVTPTVSGSRSATLRSGDEVMTGDGIQVAVKPTVDAHIYVAYCDRNHQLTVFPRAGIAAKAGTVTYAPDRYASIILDDQVGPEVLYVIASRRPLDSADPELEASMSRVRPGGSGDCLTPLDRVVDRARSSVMDDEAAAPPVPGAPGASGSPGRWLPRRPRPRVPPPAVLQRGGFVRWVIAGGISVRGDRDDIVVLRYGFTHVARTMRPQSDRTRVSPGGIHALE